MFSVAVPVGYVTYKVIILSDNYHLSLLAAAPPCMCPVDWVVKQDVAPVVVDKTVTLHEESSKERC